MGIKQQSLTDYTGNYLLQEIKGQSLILTMMHFTVLGLFPLKNWKYENSWFADKLSMY